MIWRILFARNSRPFCNWNSFHLVIIELMALSSWVKHSPCVLMEFPSFRLDSGWLGRAPGGICNVHDVIGIWLMYASCECRRMWSTNVINTKSMLIFTRCSCIIWVIILTRDHWTASNHAEPAGSGYTKPDRLPIGMVQHVFLVSPIFRTKCSRTIPKPGRTSHEPQFWPV